MCGLVRLIARGETRNIQWNYFDKLILSWSFAGSTIYIAREPSINALIYKSGVMFDVLGMYWLFRQVLQNWDDIYSTIKFFALFAILTAPLIAMEKIQNWSFFSTFGPVGGKFHRGRFRAAGPFSHYIIMGCFWASLLPFFYARIKSLKKNGLYWLATLASLSNVYFSASSTPIVSVIAIFLFWKLYPVRKYGRTIFLTTCFGLLVLHLIMKAPVWHLMARANVFGGSTGWHRYFLFDNFIKHTSEWLFLGTRSTAHWGHAQSDLTNQFVLEGIRGGVVTLLIFSILVYCSVKIPGRFCIGTLPPEVKWLSWGICVAMLGHFVTFWGVSYFGQINMLLYLTFAFVGFTLEQSTHHLISDSTPPQQISGSHQ